MLYRLCVVVFGHTVLALVEKGDELVGSLAAVAFAADQHIVTVLSFLDPGIKCFQIVNTPKLIIAFTDSMGTRT